MSSTDPADLQAIVRARVRDRRMVAFEVALDRDPPAELPAVRELPHGPLAFAGEHTAGLFAARMERAIRSGRRAARALLETAPTRTDIETGPGSCSAS